MLYPIFETVRLPRLDRSKIHELNLSGTVVSFSTPPFSATWGEQRKFPACINLYDPAAYLLPNDIAPLILCYESKWDVKGLIFLQENIGWINFSTTISKWEKSSDLFRCKNLEKTLIEYYTQMYGPEGHYNKDTYEAFLDWRIETINNTQWIYHHNVKNPDGEASYRLYWQTPISSEHYLTINVSYQVYKESIEAHNAISTFAKRLMRATTIGLSPSAQEQKAAAEKQWPNQKYSEHMEPLRWIRPKKDFISVEEYFADDDDDK
ncbi:hypothetical protein [Teredinibacter turnerae]|uniref:hypothetical protein n=1 Tax=Teredinibacter turnerae TaxID=2426 RepID=UPI0004102797|nr:hypothetical protein [Teredinibacter turnerae]